MIKQLLFNLTNIKAEEIDYFEAVFLLNIVENKLLISRAIFNLQAFHVSFGDEPGYYFLFLHWFLLDEKHWHFSE